MTGLSRGPGTNTGHGHVWSRPDRVVARCGGPRLCKSCRADAVKWRPGTTYGDVTGTHAVGSTAEDAED